MIEALAVRDFQGLAELELDLEPVTVVRGPNGSGKTSVAEAIAFVLLGEVLRGGGSGNLPDVRRFGATSATITAVLDDGTAIGRKQTATSSTRQIGPGVVAAARFADEIRRLVGDPRAIRSVLASGGLLSMAPADLQRYLVDLSGGTLDATTIAAAFPEEVRTAATACAIALPTSLADWRRAREQAEGARLARSRDLDRAKAAVVTTLRPTLDETRKAANIEKAIAALRTQRLAAEKADAAHGADAIARREERIAAAREKVADLERRLADAQQRLASAPPAVEQDVTATQASLAEARALAAKLEAEVARLDAELAERRKVAGPTDADLSLAEAIERLGEEERSATAAAAKADTADRDAKDALRDARARLARLPSSTETCPGPCRHCAVANATKARAEAEAAVVQANSTAVTTQARLAAATEKRIAAATSVQRARDAKVRVDNARAVADLERRRSELHPETVRADERRIVALLEAGHQHAAAATVLASTTDALQAAREALDALLAEPLPEPYTLTAPGIAARLDAEMRALEQARLRDALAEAVAAQEAAHARWKAHDLVTKALGPDGVIKSLVATVVEPFLAAANEALAELAPQWRVAIDPDDFGFVVEQPPGGRCRASALSRGSQWRLGAVLQIAVARLAKVPFVVFDSIEDLDEPGADGLYGLVETCRGEGIQVLVLEHVAHGWDQHEATIVEIANGRRA